ncbi:rod-determining factor RdfA [Salinarchaeum laminariae]|uniref:rod-determining factor RdfA n=1 Tax=Salinarchaeum laminariae TaxID=869888 RepID=UPI0020C0985B|nr:rod-determining factor RdfA [Salinarchaeum laminariae]
MSEDDSRPDSKVARVIDAYELDGWGETLERRWTSEVGERTSLRDLADTLNEEIMAAALRDADVSVTAPDAASTYRTLSGEGDVSRADRHRKERELEQAGIDVESVRSDFVTHQAVHTYLTSYRDAELEERSEDRTQRAVENLQRLQGRTGVVTESTIERMIATEEITDHEYEVFVDIQVVCEDCERKYSVNELLRAGGCDCDN